MMLRFTIPMVTLIMLTISSLGLAQHEVTGVVTDASTGATLPGVNIVIQGTMQGSVTNSDGYYSITAESPQDILIFTFIGYERVEEQINGRTEINIELNPLIYDADELVVIGYGGMRSENLTGSVESIRSRSIDFKPVGQTSLALQGVAPGVTITQNSGQPGKNSGQIRIRGIGTLGTAGQEPLILVDGIETSLDNIDPNDIESISVLKDAASSAIYGSRAANGVILVTTKRAEQREITVNYNSYVGWNDPTNMPSQVNGLDHMLLFNEANRNMGQDQTFSDSYIDEYRQNAPSDLFPDTDWQALTLTSNGLMQNHSLSIAGGGDLMRIRGSINYLDENGIIPNTGYTRTSIRLNTDIRASENLNFRIDLRGSDELQFEPGAGINDIFNGVFGRIPSNQEGLLSDGRYGQGWLGQNPIAQVNSSGVFDNRNYNFNVSLEGEWEPFEGFGVSLMYAPQINIGEAKSFRRVYGTYFGDGTFAFNRPTDGKSVLVQSNTQNRTDHLRALVNYSLELDQHRFKTLIGFEQIEQSFEIFGASREDFTFPEFPFLSLGSEENQRAFGSATEFSLQSYFGRIAYDYEAKYLFEANLRYDGSSRFAEKNRFGLFPAFSAGWRISQEKFLQSVTQIDDLKLRISWGQLGNQAIGNYPFASSMDLNRGYILNDRPVEGAALTNLSNQNITWETTEMINFGIDLAFFSKFILKADYFEKNTNDILLRLPIPATVGFTAPFQNAGEVSNVGWELSLNHFNSSGDFGYDFTFSLSDVKNEIKNLRETGPFISESTIRMVGNPIDAIFGFKSDGLFKTVEEIENHAKQFGPVAPGDIKYIDQNGDGLINADDRVVLGSTIPRYTFSFDFSTFYKNFDLRLFFQGVGKADAYRSGCNVWSFYVGCTVSDHHLDRWTPDNLNASYPRLAFGHPNNHQVSDYWVRSASYLRLKNLNIGYNLPSRILENSGINNARIYFSGQNLFTIDDNFFDGFDVESPLGGTGFYPMVKTYTFGISINL